MARDATYETLMRCAHTAVPLSIVLALATGASLVFSQEKPAKPSWEQQLSQYLQASRSEHDHLIKDWKEVAAWNFDDGKMPADFKVYDGEWKVADGVLRAVSGKPDGNRAIKIADCRWPAFRLEFDARLTANPGIPAERVCDIGVRFNCDAQTGDYTKGYFLLTGTYYNQATTLYRLNIPYARAELSPIVPGKLHHVLLEVVKPHIRFWVDGRVVLEAWERAGKGGLNSSDFLDMDPTRAIALHTYDTVMDVDNVRILVPAEKAKP